MTKLYIIKRKDILNTASSKSVRECPYWTGDGSFASNISAVDLFDKPEAAFNKVSKLKTESENGGVEFYVAELDFDEVEVTLEIVPVNGLQKLLVK